MNTLMLEYELLGRSAGTRTQLRTSCQCCKSTVHGSTLEAPARRSEPDAVRGDDEVDRHLYVLKAAGSALG